MDVWLRRESGVSISYQFRTFSMSWHSFSSFALMDGFLDTIPRNINLIARKMYMNIPGLEKQVSHVSKKTLHLETTKIMTSRHE